MRKGKMVAQGAHAAMAAWLERGAILRGPAPGDIELRVPLTPDEARWAEGRFAKICVSVDSEAALLDIHRQAVARGLPAALIKDSGKTEFGGVPTYTAVAVGPAQPAEIDAVTGQLSLL